MLQQFQCHSSAHGASLRQGRLVISRRNLCVSVIMMILVQSVFVRTTTEAFVGRTASISRSVEYLGEEMRRMPYLGTLMQQTEGSSDNLDQSDERSSQLPAPQVDEEQDLLQKSSYDLGLGKNKPLVPTYQSKSNEENAASDLETSATQANAADDNKDTENDENELHWYAPQPVNTMKRFSQGDPKHTGAVAAANAVAQVGKRTRKMVARDEEGRKLRGAIWDEGHFDESQQPESNIPKPKKPRNQRASSSTSTVAAGAAASNYVGAQGPVEPEFFYPDIDLSIPESVYSVEDGTDLVWDLMRWEAFQEAQREPLLVSFLHSTILGHPTLESSLAFMLANRLSSPAMISTQIQSLIVEALADDTSIGRSLRADIMAVRDRDPACTCLPDVFLYFKGFQALQTYRIAHTIWNSGKHILAHFLQSQMSQIFQIDIHPNATLGSGIMLDHGTGMLRNCHCIRYVVFGLSR